MANHLEDLKERKTCELLADEIERVVEEEVRLRKKLFDFGVRDISGVVSLPMNRLDQLDEGSADYDDKRLCHACKHVCFFSCVACECSQSKVSCLRHSHYMCRCPMERKYMMIWCPEVEMRRTLESVKEYAKSLGSREGQMSFQETDENEEMKCAPGVIRDKKNHEGYVIDISSTSALLTLPRTGLPVLRQLNGTNKGDSYQIEDVEPESKKIKLGA
mmetsp:Transcript_11133/g.15676  ORF Transcript_11133/g.15676 Transcript_11133/m.15676 type:complete len:217 (-) Transcript_11133:162-812(-)